MTGAAQGARRTLALLTALNLLNYLDRYVLAAVVPLVEADLKLSHTRAGLLGSGFIVVYALASPFAGWLGDRRSRTKLTSAGAVLFGGATFATGLAPGYGPLLAARSATGIGEAGYATVTPSLISDLFPRDARSRALTLFYAAMPVGSALGYVLGGWAGTRFGWRAAFYLAGGPAIALGLSALLLREPARGALDPEPALAAPPLGRALALLWRRRSFVANTAGQALLTFAIGGLAQWMPTYLHAERGLALETADAWFGALLALAGFLGTLAGGALADRVARRHPGAHFLVPGAGLLAAAPLAAAGILLPWPQAYWPALFLAAACIFMNTGPLNAALVNVVPAPLRATAVAANVLAIHLLGDALSPTLLGAIADVAGLQLAVLAVALVVAGGGIVLILTAPRLERDLAHPMQLQAP